MPRCYFKTYIAYIRNGKLSEHDEIIKSIVKRLVRATLIIVLNIWQKLIILRVFPQDIKWLNTSYTWMYYSRRRAHECACVYTYSVYVNTRAGSAHVCCSLFINIQTCNIYLCNFWTARRLFISLVNTNPFVLAYCLHVDVSSEFIEKSPAAVATRRWAEAYVNVSHARTHVSLETSRLFIGGTASVFTARYTHIM